MNVNELSTTRRAYLRQRVRCLQDVIPDALNTLKSVYCRGMMLTWDQEGDVGPVQVFEQLGPEALELLTEGAALLAFIKSKDPDWEPPVVPYELIVAVDGSVTLGASLLPPEPEPEPEPEA